MVRTAGFITLHTDSPKWGEELELGVSYRK
jgi:hypothetical protein